MENIIRILEFVGAAVAGGYITHILTIKSRVRGAKADADRAEADVKGNQIDNIQALVEKVYKPTIETLTLQVESLQKRVDELERENIELRTVLLEVSPENVPSRRGENGRTAPRNADGTFAKRGAE